MTAKEMKNDIKTNIDIHENKKRWCQLKKIAQICISNILRNEYIGFVLEKGRKPNKAEKEFIIAIAYLQIEENEIFISVNELRKYFLSKIPKYDISIEKL